MRPPQSPGRRARARRPPRRRKTRGLAEVRQDDRQVVDVHLAVADEIARASNWRRVWPKCDSTMVRSLMSTLPSRLASPGSAGVKR